MASLYSPEQQYSVSDAGLDLPPRWQATLSEAVVERVSRGLRVRSDMLRGLSKVLSQASFADPQVAIESILDAGQLLPPHINALIARVVAPLTEIRRPCLSPARFWRQKPPTHKRIVLVLRTFHSVKMLCEVAAKTKGARVRWRVVLLLESIQAVCRLMLLRSWRTTAASTAALLRPVLFKPVLVDGEAVLTLLEKSYRDSRSRRRHGLTPAASFAGTLDDAQRLTARLPEVVVSDSKQLLSSFLTPDENRPLNALLARAMFLFQMVEVLCILRPVVFACVLRR